MSYSLPWTSTGTFTQSRQTSRRPPRSATRRLPRRASASPPPSRRRSSFALLDVLTDASLALNAQLSSGHVEVRLAGRNPDLVVVDDRSDEAESAPTPGDNLSARITLRLPEGLKVQIEAVASSEGVSTNAWIVRALSRALEPRRDRTRSGKRLQGYAQS